MLTHWKFTVSGSNAPQPVNVQSPEQSQFAQPPIPPESLQQPMQQPQPYQQPSQQPVQSQQSAQGYTDIYGIISLVTVFVGASLVGVVLGYIGMKKAKQQGASPILSQIGFWLSLAFTIIGMLWFGFVIVALIASGGQST